MTPRRDDTSVTARRAVGRGARESASRHALGRLAQRPADYDPVGRLLAQGESRVASLLPIRYERMLQSPLAFFRGAALLMADDLSRGASTPLEVQICGDAHLSNFGIFSSPERHLVFDVNDFDETDPGPFEWDVKRLVTSLLVTSDQLGHRANQQEEIGRSAAREYRRAMTEFAQETRLHVWYAALDLGLAMSELRGLFSYGARERVEDIFSQVKDGATQAAYDKVVVYKKNDVYIRDDPPHFSRLGTSDDDTMRPEDAHDIVNDYVKTLSSDRQVLLGQYKVADVARHVVGVGSVGTECLAVLLTGRDVRDPLLLQIKEAQTSVIAHVLNRAPTFTPGERVVRGQRLMQATPDLLLGWQSIGPLKHRRSFYVRQLYDNKASVNVQQLNERLLTSYGRVCAWTLARAHARSGLSAEIAGYLGKGTRFEEAMTDFARSYVKQNHQDYDAMKRALHEGRFVAAH